VGGFPGVSADIIPHLTIAQEADEQVFGRIGIDVGVTAERFLPLPVNGQMLRRRSVWASTFMAVLNSLKRGSRWAGAALPCMPEC
jgi:hypothetical protein